MYTSFLRSVLAERFKGISEETEAMILGQMLHKVFQAILMRCQEMGGDMRGVALEEALKKEAGNVVTSLESLNHL